MMQAIDESATLTKAELAEMLWDSDTQALFASIIAFHFGGRAFGK